MYFTDNFYALGSDPGKGGPCTISHYCPSGTSTPLPCPAGSYNNVTGQANCTICPEGYYCPEKTETYEVYQCPAGHYCPNGTEHAYQYPCPRGYYRNVTHGMSRHECYPCPGGMYCGQEGLTYPSGYCSQGN